MTEGSHAADPQLRIRQLEQLVARITTERDDLAKDVEQLCLSRGGHMFSSSYVASERLRFLESELKEQRQLLRSMTLQCDSLQEDVWALKAAKKQSDEGWQHARQQSGELQKELEFFKASSARAIAERDRAAFDAQSLRTELEATGSALQDSKSQLVLAQQVSQDLQGQLGSLQQQLEAEQQEAAAVRVQLRQVKQLHEQQLQQQRQAQQQLERDLDDKQEVLKGVQAELASAQALHAQLASEVSELKVTAATCQQQLEGARAAADTAKAQAAQFKAANVTLHKQLNSSTLAVHDLQTLLEQTSAALVASQARLKGTHAGPGPQRSDSSSPTSSAGLQQEIKALKAQLAEAEEQLQQAARDKLQVQLELSQAQAEEDEYAYTLMELQQLYHHCKELLATATQQKVEALLQVAKAEAGSLTAPSQPQAQRSSAAPAGELGVSAFATPPASPSLQRPKAAGPAPGSAASSSASTGGPAATPDTPHEGHTEPAALDTDTEPAALDTDTVAAAGKDTGLLQPEPQLPVSTPAAMPDSSMHGAVAGSDRLAGVQHAEQSALPAARGLAQLLLLAHHYLTLLQQLPPADVAAAAQGGGTSKGRAGGRRAAGGPAAGDDALKRLAAASQDLDRDRQQLLSSSQLKQQQLDGLVNRLLAQSVALGAGAGAAIAGAGQGQPGSQSTAGHSSPAGGRGALKKLLRAAQGGSPAAAAAASAGGAAPAGTGSGAGPSSGSSDSLDMSGLISRIAAGCASDAHAPQQLLSCPDVAGVSAADLSGLQLALCHEVQLLAEVGLAALRYIPKVTALNSLMQGAW